MMQDQGALDRGIAAHARWKYRLFQAVKTGKSEWTVAGVRAAGQCEFAKWLSSLSPTEKASEHYVKVKDLHAQFHEVASEVLALALSGDKQRAEEAIALDSRFTAVSSSLTLAIMDWKEAPGA